MVFSASSQVKISYISHFDDMWNYERYDVHFQLGDWFNEPRMVADSGTNEWHNLVEL